MEEFKHGVTVGRVRGSTCLDPTAAQRTSLSCTGLRVLCERGRSVVRQEDAVMAMRLKPVFRQWTSEVTGTSEKRARSRDNLLKPPLLLLSQLSMSLTTLRIS